LSRSSAGSEPSRSLAISTGVIPAKAGMVVCLPATREHETGMTSGLGFVLPLTILPGGRCSIVKRSSLSSFAGPLTPGEDGREEPPPPGAPQLNPPRMGKWGGHLGTRRSAASLPTRPTPSGVGYFKRSRPFAGPEPSCSLAKFTGSFPRKRESPLDFQQCARDSRFRGNDVMPWGLSSLLSFCPAAGVFAQS
jgi:hypothetical protein